MSNIYSNLPFSTPNDSANSTIRAFDNYYSQPIEIDTNVYNAMVGFFASKKFERLAAENISVIIIKQAKKDNYNPMKILDTLKGLDSVELSALVAEIINYNRFKTSFLGYALQFKTSEEVLRNIIA